MRRKEKINGTCRKKKEERDKAYRKGKCQGRQNIGRKGRKE